ncbi:MAG: YchJ family protein [Polyangiaceae bacterium]
MTPPKNCPCHSGLRYAACCAPLHQGAPAPTPEALMRSRYAAFALGLGEYLVETLASSHPDRGVPRDGLVTELSRAKDRQRFLGLRIVRAQGDQVLFDARIFERGEDRSFAELSTFVREEGRWLYANGRVLTREELAEVGAELTPAS